jgi:geranylgeranyl diphosphate synthase type II
MAAAVAIELMHCASLVHDDLPCFDDAAMRRGRPSVHRAFDERIALLAGDALIVLAFQSLARAAIGSPSRLGKVITIVASAVGAPGGIIAGQAWECEPQVPLSSYQRAKTGALFAAAAAAGASAAGHEARAGTRSASAWARPTRSPTTSATWYQSPPTSASPPDVIRRSGGRTRF